MRHARRLWILAGFLLASTGWSCAPEIPQEPPPDIVRALWNPTTGTVPTPTNLVRNDDTPQLDLPIDDDLPAAEKEFRRYLNSLDGYPLSSSLSIPTSDAVSSAGLAGSFVVLDVDTGESLQVNPSVAEDGSIEATQLLDESNDGWQPGHTYVFGLRGYDGGVQGADGELVVADAPFFLIRTDEDIREHPYAVPGETRADREETAETLEEVRQEFLPLYSAMEQRGVPRDEIAVASIFTTTNRPSFWFDADRQIVPVPNGLLVDPDTGLVDLPTDEDDDETSRLIKEEISKYDGGSITGPISFSATAPIDPTTLTPQSIRLLEVDPDSGEVSEVVELDYGVLDDPTHGYVAPKLKLESNTYYVLAATRAVSSGGIPLEPQPIAALLRSESPLVEGGASQVSSLDLETAELLEEWRGVADVGLSWLGSQGVSRDSISQVVPFKTMSTKDELLRLRAQLYEDEVTTAVTNVTTKTPLERGLPIILNSVETITTGTFEIRDYIDPRTRRFRADGPQPNLVDFVLTVPEGYSTGDPIPVVLFGHGLFTSRELVYLIADKLAEAGFAIFSFDLPYHGRRTACLRDADCAGNGTCDDLGQCSNGEFAQISSPFPDGPEYPAATGSAFIEIDNIVGAKDHFAQAAIDMFQALRVVRGANWSEATGGYVLDGSDVVYLGMSLGGILGAIVAGAEPTIEDFVLNVPGGDLFTVFQDSSAFQTAFADVLEDRMAPEGSDAFFELEAALRWMLDRVDPLNVAPFALNPYPYLDPVDGQEKQSPVKRVMIQMADGDLVVPNSSTRLLSAAMGVPIREYTPAVSNHAFLFDPTSLEGARARQDIVDFFEAR